MQAHGLQSLPAKVGVDLFQSFKGRSFQQPEHRHAWKRLAGAASSCFGNHFSSSLILHSPSPPSPLSSCTPRFSPSPSPHPCRYISELTKAATTEYIALAKKKGITPTTLALAWCYNRWYMGSVIIGATSLAQLKVIGKQGGGRSGRRVVWVETARLRNGVPLK